MKDRDFFDVAALAVALVAVFGVVIGVGIGSAIPAPPSTGAPVVKPAYLYLTIAWNPATGLDEYFPANFSVPAHTPILITITSYDNGTNPVPPTYSQVIGTVGGVSSDSVGGGPASQVRVVSASSIAHTFTVMANGVVSLNVPVPSARSVSLPTVVSFETYFNQTGAFQWRCMAPCDPWAMQAPGLMSGTIEVVG